MPALPFTLWLSPDVWPRPALRLPGEAHTLWLDPECWPRPPLRLPSAGYTLWLDEKTWPGAVPAPAEPEIADPAPPAEPAAPPVTNLLWLDTESWPIPPEPEPAVRPEPGVAALAELPPAPFPSIEPAPPRAAPELPAMTPRLTLSANHSFTLWTTPAALAGALRAAAPAVAPHKTTAPKLRLSGQPFTLWTQPGRVEPVFMRNGANTTTAAVVTAGARAATMTGATRWLPLAAGIAIAALFGMSYSSQKAQREAAESDLGALQAKASVEVDAAMLVSQKAQAAATDARTKLAAREFELNGQMAELKTAVTKSEVSAKEKASLAEAKTAELDAAKKALSEAKKESAAKETTLQASATALTEEMSKLKKTAGEETSKAHEAMARLEEEKAAAVKDATNAMSDRDALKAEVEKLRKQLEQKAKPPGGPEA